MYLRIGYALIPYKRRNRPKTVFHYLVIYGNIKTISEMTSKMLTRSLITDVVTFIGFQTLMTVEIRTKNVKNFEFLKCYKLPHFTVI